MKQRAITAFFFAAIMIGGIYFNRTSFQVLFTVIAAGMLWEFFGLVISSDDTWRKTRKLLGSFIGVFPVLYMGAFFAFTSLFVEDPPANDGNFDWSLYVGWGISLLILTGFLTMIALAVELFQPSRPAASAVGSYLTGLFYIGLPFVWLFFLATPNGAYTPNRVLGLLWLIWTNDVFAYLIGSRFGKTKLYEVISPKKTWEGTIGGAVCTVIMAVFVTGWVPDYNPDQWLALGIIVALLATPGDLIESMLKRSAGVKDSGSLMPGHGGLLDRFDSFIFVLPFAWLAVILLGG